MSVQLGFLSGAGAHKAFDERQAEFWRGRPGALRLPGYLG